MTTRDILRLVGKTTGVGEEDSRRVLNMVIEEGVKVILDGDEWHLPGFGKLMVELDDYSTPKVVFKPYKEFSKKIESDFCENRELQV